MNIYFDCEFTGLKKDTSLISMGLVSDNDDQLYLEFSDYNRDMCDDWIQKNVINNLYNGLDIEQFIKNPKNKYNYADKDTNKIILEEWLRQFNENIQFISDVCHYDMVLLIDLFENAFCLPNFISPACYDINQEIASFYNINCKQAFDKNREDIIKDFNINIPNIKKHNALYDANVIKLIYKKIKQ